VFVRKYDHAGTEVWTRQFGTSASDSGYGVAVNTTGVYVTGFTEAALPGQTFAGGRDVFIRSYDHAGTEVWTRQLGTSVWEEGRGVAVRGPGVFVVGDTQGALPGQASAGESDAFVLKYGPPEAFGKVGPADGAAGQPVDPWLVWGAAAGAVSYECCYDTTNNDACDGAWTSVGAATTVQLTGLEFYTAYWWQVRAVNSLGTTDADGGTWRSFTTGGPPGAFSKTAPANAAIGVALNPTLSWGAASHADSYAYCYDTTNNGACDGSWTSTGSGTSAGLAGLTPSTTYYWQVEASNAFGTTDADGGTWRSFATDDPPGAFGKTAPANGAVGQPFDPTLSWGAAAGADSYAYCYDTTNNGACDGTWTSTGSGTSAGLAGLTPNTPYYWQVKATNSFGTTDADGGAWWGFTTVSSASFRSQGLYDGWVLEQSETSGLGGMVNATATTGRVGDDAADRQYRSLLHFNTATLPDKAVVVGVTVRIRQQGMVGTNPFHTHGQLTVDIKSGAFHGVAALERFDFHAVGSRANVGWFGESPVGDWHSASLQATAYPLVNLEGTTQFRLRFVTGDNDDAGRDYLSFYTGNASAGRRPELIVTYYVP